ncbi:uncharacterized protein METZ01_LOCUS172885 [marine metagenome]|uniref:Methyltransferase domain-containing protein n=1 Tax=marine metagenome TaxID=408172 RepID=A0A382C2R4_9ZZZZ
MPIFSDQRKWNERYRTESQLRRFDPSPVFEEAMAAGIPDGSVMELACGVSGNALALAMGGREVLAVDVSDVALGQLQAEAQARGVSDRINCVQTDLAMWRPPEDRRFALVLCVMYWDRTVFQYAWPAVQEGGLIAWQAFNTDQVKYRPIIQPKFCLQCGEPASLLPEGFTMVSEHDVDDGHRAVRRLIARHEGENGR